MTNKPSIFRDMYFIETQTEEIDEIIGDIGYYSHKGATQAMAKTCIRVMKKTGSPYLDLIRSCKISSYLDIR